MVLRMLLAGAAALALAPAVRAEWHEASSAHFVVYSDDSPARVKDYAERLERFDRAVRILHADTSRPRGTASRVIVFVLPTVSDIQRLSPNAAGFWQPHTIPVAVMPRASSGDAVGVGFTPQAIMFHEYTHHWMLTSWSDAAIPAWYAEGAAELHATAMFRPDGSVIFGAVPRYRTYGVALRNQMPVSKLLAAGRTRMDRDETTALYGRGWLLTHYLTFDDVRRKQLGDYIGAINGGKSAAEAAPLLGDIGSLDLKLDNYGQRQKLPSIQIPADQLAIGAVAVRKLTPGEAAAMPVRIRSSTGVSDKTAPVVVALARKVAAAYPDDPAVQNALAEAEYDNASTGSKAEQAAGYARARTAADRAIAADPKSVHALIYRGMAEEALAVNAERTDAATWNGVRRWYIQANRADTEAAEPLIRFYTSFAAAKQKPTASADKGMLYAYALAPHDRGARMLATRVLLEQGKAREARIALAPIVYTAEGDASVERSRTILAMLDRGDAAGALAELNKAESDAEAERKKAEGKQG